MPSTPRLTSNFMSATSFTTHVRIAFRADALIRAMRRRRVVCHRCATGVDRAISRTRV